MTITPPTETGFLRRVYTNGFCVVPLAGVLEILNLKITYTETEPREYIFRDRSTKREAFRYPRNEQYPNPWPILWERKLIGEKPFTKAAQQWFRNNGYIANGL